MKDKKIVFGILGLLACVILGLFCFYIKRSDEECVGYYMGDLTIEPIVFRDEIYFPNPAYPYDENRDFDLDMKLCGNIKNQYLYENKGKLKIPLYYMGYFWVDQVWVDKKYTEYEHIEVRGGYTNEYTKATYLENPSRIYQLFEEYSNCMLISKEYTSENQCTVQKYTEFCPAQRNYPDTSALRQEWHIPDEEEISL